MAELDQELRETLQWVESLSDTDPDKHEMLAFIYMTCARAEWRKAESYRKIRRDAERRTERRRRACEPRD